METLSDLVRSLAIIIILGSLLEMFLPSGELKNFVQVIIGLFILVTVLNPLLGIFNHEWTTELQAWTNQSTGVPLEEILARGNQVRADHQQQALAQYKQKLTNQITGLANLGGEVEVQKANVEVNGQAGVLGKIIKIQLNVIPVTKKQAKTEGNSGLVQPVVIDLTNAQSDQQTPVANTSISPQTIRQLKSTLANLYGINPEAVEINEKTDELGK